LIGEPGDALGNGEIDTGDVDGDGALDVVIGSDRLGPGHVVRRVHLLELRMALDRVYDAAGRSRPSYTDALLADDAPVRATHLNELRRAVVALE
jgi:hypothetical protein